MNINDIKSFKAIILLNEMIINNRQFQTILNGDDHLLEPLFIDLLSKGYIGIDGSTYIPTALGEKAFNNFMQRYNEYLKLFDVFAFVDLEAGEFAFSKYFDFKTDAEWDIYKSQERFDDLRVAVAMFKKMNAHEIVFMSFINENRFDTSSTGWQMDLLSDAIWIEIDQIVMSAISPVQLGEPDVIEDIVRQGSALVIDLIKQEAEQKKAQLEVSYGRTNDELYDEEEEIVEEIVYYESYYDPFYLAPIWYVPLFIW